MRILIFVLIFFVANIGHSERGGIKHKRIECRPDEVAKGFAMPRQTNIFIIIDNNDKKVKVYEAISEIKYSKTDYIIYKSINTNKERCIISNISTRLVNKINKTGNLKIHSKIIKIKNGTIQCESYIIFDKKMSCSGKFLFIIPSKFNI